MQELEIEAPKKNKDRIAATMYPLGMWFVSGICVWIPCIKETTTTTMMMIPHTNPQNCTTTDR